MASKKVWRLVSMPEEDNDKDFLSDEELNAVIDSLKWSINSGLDDFSLSGDRVIHWEQDHIVEYVLDDIDKLTAQLSAFKRLLLMREGRK